MLLHSRDRWDRASALQKTIERQPRGVGKLRSSRPILVERRTASGYYKIVTAHHAILYLMNSRIFLLKAALALAALVFAPVSHADIYVSDQRGETPVFSNYAADGSYRLFIADEKHRVRQGDPDIAIVSAMNDRRLALEPLIVRVAERHAVDSALVRAIIEVESNFNPHAMSLKGALGYMQLMSHTAQRYGVVDRRDPLKNLDAGVAHLKNLLNRYGGNIPLALAAYNAGEGAVQRYRNGIPRYRETMLYVPQVLAAHARYREEAMRSAH
jgi:soluble lytic murein transglycosylase-like protein